MLKLNPIIGVKDVALSSVFYQALLGLQSKHGGEIFDVLTDADGATILCLHGWGDHQHPTLMDPGSTAGHGLILYFKTSDLASTRKNADALNCRIEEEIHLNENSLHKEFSLRDPDGYYLTISEYHEYDG